MNLLDNAPPKTTPDGLLVFARQNVVQPGDTMSIHLDPKTKKTKQMVVTTSEQGDQVGLSSSFNTLCHAPSSQESAPCADPPWDSWHSSRRA